MHLLIRLFLITLVVAGSCSRHAVLAAEALVLNAANGSALLPELKDFEPPDAGECTDPNSCGTGGGR
jgi:hypothetical protein